MYYTILKNDLFWIMHGKHCKKKQVTLVIIENKNIFFTYLLNLFT